MNKPLIATSLGCIFALVTTPSCPADTAPSQHPRIACPAGEILATTDRARSSTTPCVVPPHDFLLEMGYYQNASSVGGTQQAAYPLGVIRYGLVKRVEIVLAPETRIAKSGLRGKGIYTYSRSGGGIRYTITDSVRNNAAVNLQFNPQSDETASLSTRDRYDFSLADRYAITENTSVSAALGNIVFSEGSYTGNRQSDLYGRLAISRALSSRAVVNVLAGRDSQVTFNSMPQTKLGLSVQDKLSNNAAGDFEIGDALNASGNTKTHYIGFGVSLKQ